MSEVCDSTAVSAGRTDISSLHYTNNITVSPCIHSTVKLAV